MSDLSDIFKETADWTEEYIDNLIDENNYGSGSDEGDELMLKIASHPNTSPGWLEDFCFSGAHPHTVMKQVAGNPNTDEYLLNELYQRKDTEDWKEIDKLVLDHENCPESLKGEHIESESMPDNSHNMNEELKGDIMEKKIYNLIRYCCTRARYIYTYI